MFDKVRKFLSPPIFEDAEKNFIARILNTILIAAICGLAITLTRDGIQGIGMPRSIVVIILSASGIYLIGYFLLKRGRIYESAYLTIFTSMTLPFLLMVSYDGIHDMAILLLPLVMIMGSVLLSWQGFVILSISIILGFSLVALAEVRDTLVTSFSAGTKISDAIDGANMLAITALITGLLANSLRRNIRHLDTALKERERSEERYRLISTLSTDYVFSSTVHKDGSITHDWQSGAFESMSGYTPGEFIAHGGWRTTVHPDDLEIDDQLLEKIKRNEKASGELRVITKEGETRWIREYVHPVWGENENRLIGIYGAVQDIDEQKKAEDKLRQRADQQEALQATLIDLSSELEMPKLLQIVLERAVRLSNTDVGELGIFDEKSSELVIVASYGLTRDYVGTRMVVGEGTIGHAIARREGFIVDDYQLWSSNSKQYDKEVFHASLAMPMFFGERLLGAIALGYLDNRKFTREDMQLLTPYATQAAIAIENARLYQAEQERRREAETLRSSLTNVVTLFELEDIVERILDQIKLVIPYDTASVWRVDGEWLTLIVGRDLPPELPSDLKMPIDDDANAARQLLIQGEIPFILKNNVQEELTNFKGSHSYINSWLVVPLKKRGKIIGQIALDGRKKGQFTVHHAELAVIFADQVAIALENASLYSEIQQELTERKRAEEALRQREALYRHAIEAAGAVPYHQDYLTEQYTFMGERIRDITGYSTTEMTPALWHAIEQEAYMRGEGANLSVEEAFQKARAGQLKVWQYEAKLLTREGKVRWIADSAVETMNEQGEVVGSIGILQDITERKQVEEEIRQLNIELENRVTERTAQLNEANQNLHQEKARLEQYSRQRELMGTMTDLLQASLTTEEASRIVSRYMQLLFPNRDGALYLLNISAMLEPVAIWGEQKSLDTMFDMNDCWALRRGKSYRFGSGSPNPPCVHVGEEITHSALCIPITAQGENLGSLHISTENIGDGGLIDDEEQRFIETITDSIALALANLRLREKLRIQSIRDPLTGIFNRRYLEETLEREVHRAGRNREPLCVVMFEIDDFKQYNNTFGHDAGDYVLKKVADTMQSNLRKSDFPCRYGGDEFTFLLPNTTIEDGAHRAEELRKEIAALALSFNNQALGQVTVRMGVAVYPKHGETGEAVIKVADDASYRARAIGKNCVVVAD